MTTTRGVVAWSPIAANNATADQNGVNWSEGQAPSSINDSARSMMASTALWRDDITGVLVTAGSGTAFTLATNQVFASNAAGYTVQFVSGATNTGAVTLAVDGNTAKPLRFLTGTDLPAGVLISGSLYQATFRTASDEWLLHSSPLAAPFLVPLGALIDYTGLTSPSANFILPQGQAISRTVYAAYFSLVSTTYGGGDGSTTFNVIDLVGRGTAMRDAGSARLSTSYFGSNPAILGNSGGTESSTLTLLQTPGGITSANGGQNISVTTNVADIVRGSVISSTVPAGGSARIGGSNMTGDNTVTSSGSNSISVTSANTGASGNGTGAAAPHNNVQPTAIVQKLLRVL